MVPKRKILLPESMRNGWVKVKTTTNEQYPIA